jgi:GTPase
MQFRLIEGEGKAYYYIGVCDNGEIGNTNDKQFKFSFKIISYSCNSLNAVINKIYKFNLPNKQYYVFCLTSNKKYNILI